jgi:hypothetical protein
MKEAGSWDLTRDLWGGTPTMRAAGKTWLPKEPDEKNTKYKVRVGRSFLHNAYKNTIEKYVARPFSRPVKWDVKNPEAKAAIEPVLNDMDGEGLHHQNFAKELFRMMLKYGVSSAFVDYPKVDQPEEVNQEQADEKELRPVNKVLKTPKVIGWELQEQENGTEKVVQIRIKESYIEDGDDFTQTAYDQIRVVTVKDGEAKWELFRKEKKKGVRNKDADEWKPAGSGEILIDGEVPDDMPIVTAYTDKTGILTALPAFLEMAWTNLELWISASDQKNILRFDRLGILMGSGFTEDEIKAGIKIAPTQAVMSENPEAKLDRVETNGAPAENGWKDIRDIMERLEIQGMDPMIQRLANVKAAGINANEDKSRSQVESWIDAINIAMRQVIQLNLAFMGFEVELDDIEYAVSQDFIFATKTAQEVKDVIEMRKMGEISSLDFVKEMQRYGRIADGDAREIVARARVDRGTGLGMFGENGQQGAPGQQGEQGAAAQGEPGAIGNVG